MSHSDSILSVLKIKGLVIDPKYPDPREEVFKGQPCFVIRAIVSPNSIPCCPCCGKAGIKYGFTRISHIKLPDMVRLSLWVFARKQRYQCPCCHKTFQSATNLVDKFCFISNVTKNQLILDATEKISLDFIARKNRVSRPTVQREINRWKELLEPSFTYLPEVLCIDEFKGTRIKNAKMAVSLVDGIDHTILDIRVDRKLNYLTQYFMQYPKEVREKVKFVCMDMYEPFLQLSRRVFPNAQIIIDKFHVVQAAANALNACRIEVMKKEEDPKRMKLLKKFWRLILTKNSKIVKDRTLWVPHLQTHKTEETLLEEMLSSSTTLRNTHEIYQQVISAYSMVKPQKLDEVIADAEKDIHSQMKTTLKTFRKLKKHIKNGIIYGYSNGPIEANNNNIKVLKRVAYGYRNYNNLRARILLVYTDKIKMVV